MLALPAAPHLDHGGSQAPVFGECPICVMALQHTMWRFWSLGF